jgi:hypothetical protein
MKKNVLKKIYALCVLILVLAEITVGCSEKETLVAEPPVVEKPPVDEPTPPEEPPAAPPIVKSSDLAGTHWRLVRFVDSENNEIKNRKDIIRDAGVKDNGDYYTLTFPTDSTFTGVTVNNTLEGAYCMYTITGDLLDSLVISDVSPTDKGAKTAGWEDVFMNELKNEHLSGRYMDLFNLYHDGKLYLQFSSDTIEDMSAVEEKLTGKWQQVEAYGSNDRVLVSTGEIWDFLHSGMIKKSNERGEHQRDVLYRITSSRLYVDYFDSPLGHVYSYTFPNENELLIKYEWGAITESMNTPIRFNYKRIR